MNKIGGGVAIGAFTISNIVMEGSFVTLDAATNLVAASFDAAGNLVPAGDPITGILDSQTGILGLPAASYDSAGNLVATIALYLP